MIHHCFFFQNKINQSLTKLNQLNFKKSLMVITSNSAAMQWYQEGIWPRLKVTPLRNAYMICNVLTAYTARVYILIFMFLGCKDHVQKSI